MQVVYEDRWLVVVHKPSGLPTQGDRQGTPDLYSQLRRGYAYLALHHRLDRPASGLVMFAKHRDANAGLAEGFRTHSIRRTYLAVLAPHPSSEASEGTWTGDVDGKHAETHWRLLGAANGLCTAELRPQTGRKHQLRRHCAENRRAIVGDRRYGGDVATWWERLCLHAHRMELTHPVTGTPLTVDAPLPADLREVWSLAGG